MRYIRTEDGRIIDISDIELFEDELANTDFGDGNIGLYAGIPVIKSANTIEDLCDEFVLFKDNKPYAIVPNKGHNSELAKDVWKDYRGAIWTDKGLIYVAKKNDKGELELL